MPQAPHDAVVEEPAETRMIHGWVFSLWKLSFLRHGRLILKIGRIQACFGTAVNRGPKVLHYW
jgi:hypothetical protein